MRSPLRGWRFLGIVTAVLAALTGTTTTTAARATTGPPPAPHGPLDPAITAIMDKPAYAHAQWGLLETDPETGRVFHSMYPHQFFIPGSAEKLFSVSGAWDTLGGDHRFTTPVQALGTRRGSVLRGSLVLVAQGDLTMGGRTKPDGTVDFTTIDHTYANDIPGATLTPEDPLAGLDSLARQVRATGITEVNGDVVVDDRLFARPDLDPRPSPLIVNDNVIDLLTTPTSPGEPAELLWRPQVAPYRVTSTVRTVPAGGTTDIQVSASADGTRITLSGTVAADSPPVLRISPVSDPSAFGRTALIEALARAGVRVTAAPTGPNPVSSLPPAPVGGQRVAAYVSPVYAEYAKLILKVSHNLGANLALCNMATATGSRDCEDGFPVLRSFLQRADVDPTQIQLADGRGGDPVDRATPVALHQILRHWLRTPEADRFRTALPILGVDGSLALSCTACPAKGKVFAKTGTVAGGDALNQRYGVGAQTLAGYLVARHGRLHTFFVGVNGASAANVDGLLEIGDDVNTIAALLQQQAAGHPHGGPRGS
ncbi:D-alanyl-D-alanine carboxypeptidase/D-alanyl-D-alanine endopeptidase [Streptomyces sp. bgisy060]|uniref:D-alanyl-D-alanine carboxypeptidase/D-alanyl-D-alanine endopeptidase n=1 Tax=Streptomyces sp. bgisy060 TaxID=3413775 RepID=UPI003EBB2BED